MVNESAGKARQGYPDNWHIHLQNIIFVKYFQKVFSQKATYIFRGDEVGVEVIFEAGVNVGVCFAISAKSMSESF